MVSELVTVDPGIASDVKGMYSVLYAVTRRDR